MVPVQGSPEGPKKPQKAQMTPEELEAQGVIRSQNTIIPLAPPISVSPVVAPWITPTIGALTPTIYPTMHPQQIAIVADPSSVETDAVRAELAPLAEGILQAAPNERGPHIHRLLRRLRSG